jgi:ATP sulfurylase
VQGTGESSDDSSDKLDFISGSQARAMFLRGESPPSWFMRPEISEIVLDALNDGKQVFEEQEVQVSTRRET